jgi:eukaryotic-like serine/threonine-protein kinase
MTPELYQRLKPLYEAALDRPAEERHQFAKEACGDDDELRQGLEALLAASDEGSGTLDAPLVSLKDHFLKRQRTFSDGDLIMGRFRIVRLLGFGGMGEVYEAEDRLLQGIHVALKTILPEIAADPELRKRFEREVLLAQQVTHPNLCPIYTIFHCEEPSPGFLFLTMKLLPGKTLAARLREPAAMSIQAKFAVLSQMALGLAAIHDAGIIHRDIKTNNVMIDDAGSALRLWITDFGLARAYETETTISGKLTVAGTYGYIAPELFLGHPPSQASDLFAFGVLMHEVFTGQKPTLAPDGSSYLISRELKSPPVPAFCVELVTQCLQNDQKRRCTAFEKALKEIDPKGARERRSPAVWTRRRFVASAAASAGALAASSVWWKWDDIVNLFDPLPQKRFVALLNWPKTSDGQVIPMLTGVLTAIKGRLSRVEAFDRNFSVISPEDVNAEIANAPRLKEICDSLGANLVLAASVVPQGQHLQLLLRVLDPLSGRALRRKTLSCALDKISSLPGHAVQATASLLDVNRYLPSQEPSDQGTQSTPAFLAFQSAETLMSDPNDAHLDAAIEKYKEAVDLDPRFAMGFVKLAEAYCVLEWIRREPGALEMARWNCERALTLDPSLVEGYVAQAQVMEQSGNEKGALDQFATALKLDPSNPKTLLWQARLYTRLDRWADAETTYDRVLKERPNYWVTYNVLGDSLDKQGRFQDAILAFRAATVAAPASALPWSNLGSEYLQIGNFTKAVECLKKSVALDPSLPIAAANTSLALRYQRKYQEALPFALKAVQLNPADDANWLELGDCYISLPNREKDARNAYRRAAEEAERHLQSDNTNGPVWMVLALYNVKSGKPQDALSLIQKAESFGADDMDSQLYKARTLELLGKREQALDTLAICFRRGASSLQIEPFPDMQSLRKDPRYLDLAKPKLAPTQTSVTGRLSSPDGISATVTNRS